MAKFQVQPKAKKVPVTKPTVTGFLPFGTDDYLPQTLIDVIDDSDTATGAMQARAEFIVGNGIEDEALANMIVNRKGETLDEVVEGMAWNIAQGQVICLLIGYNGNFQVNDIRSVPWEIVRLGEPDDNGNLYFGGVFPYLDKSFKKDRRSKYTRLPLFDPDPEIVMAQILAVGGIENYHGQLLYVKVGPPSTSYYQKPSYFGGVKNMETENELVEFDFSTVVNGFNISGVWKQLRSSKKTQRKNRDGTVDEVDEDEDGVIAQLRANQGGENGGNLILAEADSVDELKAMGFEPTTGTAGLADRYNSTNERVMQRIARRLRVPNEILNIRKSGGIAPTGEEMKVASKVMQQSVNKEQRRIDQTLAKVLPYWHKPLPETHDYHLENLDYFTDGDDTASGMAQPD
ncbi:hypothetical protein IC229_27445 [Spirosoma sp. BT702]|uniref:Portal protein n=1 Tax=Spirosoma profusum TaxID=2771354 RepID=A0A926Y5E4_9BACT|nr:hypothetical protein [Spirosoma profusum]MBD2704406.1 hypothetical protein [Spirosoma profusum]